MPEAVLYDYWRSSASWRVRIALNLAGIDWQSRPVDLLAHEQRGVDHLVRNPQGLVPVLEIDGLRLTQSLAILDYFEETGRVSLRPSDPGQAARMRAIAQAIACDLHPVCNLRVAAHAAALTGRENTSGDWMRHFIRPGLDAIEPLLDQNGPYCMGVALTQADLCLIPQLYNAVRWGVETADLPRITRVAQACAGLDAFRKANPEAMQPAPI
ncbi:maleylacetoacetate isomerase [Ponticoccus alexandrii]|uniref:Maleylacetoacetate isomerase n=1 Tax=Ponticoccus alexandrii TaxID=1943633 RepID=A0ABX7FEC1_9RHOB|nr:maleylacetoacetate isomerase [Ponticoccus alexandrii]ETA52275.1 maleylacetoacetate isomerase [Rhodobacteraceae bacterium PD-2]QRF68910.1 maleylacetoacetate isomerase [Ponticoccus alexandrii]